MEFRRRFKDQTGAGRVGPDKWTQKSKLAVLMAHIWRHHVLLEYDGMLSFYFI